MGASRASNNSCTPTSRREPPRRGTAGREHAERRVLEGDTAAQLAAAALGGVDDLDAKVAAEQRELGRGEHELAAEAPGTLRGKVGTGVHDDAALDVTAIASSNFARNGLGLFPRDRRSLEACDGRGRPRTRGQKL